MTYSENEWLEKLNQLIEINSDNPNFTTDDYCRELGLSRSQLFRLVKEHTSLSISLYIRQRKLLKAKALLDTTTLKIAEISYQIGIDSPQSFSKFFTKEFGISPTEYRKSKFIQREDSTDSVVPLAVITEKQVPQKSIKNYLYVGMGITVLLLFVLSFYYRQNDKNANYTEGAPSSENSVTSIAILPFKNANTPETTFFADGVMEQVYESLAFIENLKITSKSSSSLFKDSKKTIPQIAQELGVAYILEGSVVQFDKHVRVSIELVKGAEDRTIWTKSYDGKAKDIIAIMNKAAKEIIAELHQKLTTEQMQKLEKLPTTDIEAYNEYLQGKHLFMTREDGKIRASLLKFDAAIAIDPHFSLAYANKAAAYFSLGNIDAISLDSSFRLAEKAALKAIRLDAENGVAYAVLANIYKTQNKWEQAMTTFQIALKYSPNDAQINYWYSLALRSIGKFDAAIQCSEKGMALDPLHSMILVGHIGNCTYAQKFDLAKKSIKDGEILFNDAYMLHWAIAFYHLNLEDYENALKEFNIGVQLSPRLKEFQHYITYTKAKMGQIEQAKNYLQSLPIKPINYPYFATIYAGMGDKEQCLKYLEMGAANNIVPDYLKVSPIFKFLQNDKRFDAVLQRVGLMNPIFDLQK